MPRSIGRESGRPVARGRSAQRSAGRSGRPLLLVGLLLRRLDLRRLQSRLGFSSTASMLSGALVGRAWRVTSTVRTRATSMACVEVCACGGSSAAARRDRLGGRATTTRSGLGTSATLRSGAASAGRLQRQGRHARLRRARP